MNRLKQYRNRVNKQLGELRHTKSLVREERTNLKQVKQKIKNLTQAQEIAQLVAKTVQQRAHEKIARVVSRCLAAVFDDPYEFQIHFVSRRGKTEAEPIFVRDGYEYSDPQNDCGLGTVDVAAFALRLSCLTLSRSHPRKLLLLDEAFRFVSVEYRDQVRTLLETISEEMGVQIVLITHDESLLTIAGRTITITPKFDA